MKCGRGMPPLSTHEVLDLALDLADVLDHAAHAVAQPLDLRAEKRIFISSAEIFFCSLEVLRRLVAFLGQHDHACFA